MNRKMIFKGLISCIVMMGLISILYSLVQVQKNKNDTKKLTEEVPLLGQKHYFDEETKQDIATIEKMKPSSKNELVYFNQLLKTYFVYDMFEKIDIKYEFLADDGSQMVIQEVIDKKSQRYYVKEIDSLNELVKVYEKGAFYYIDENNQQYVREDREDTESEFKNSLNNYGFDLRFSEYLMMLMSVIERGDHYVANVKKDEFVMTGKIDNNQSEALVGEFEFISDSKTGVVKKLSFTSNKQLLYQVNNLSIDMNSIFLNQSSFLPVLANYKKTTMESLINN